MFLKCLLSILFLNVFIIAESSLEEMMKAKYAGKNDYINTGLNTMGSNSNYVYGPNSGRASNKYLTFSGLDQNLDEQKYHIGTGDGFSIYLWGTINKQISTVVDIEGNLIIPEIGSVKLKGETLHTAKAIIKNKVLEQYKKVEMEVVFDKIRDFKVYLLGEVDEPGAFIVNGATRISDLLQLAGGINETGSKRKVLIQNAMNSSSFFADMVLFNNCNSIEKNPYLNEGDRVFVQKINDVIMVDGAVNYPGKYDYIENDSLAFLLKLTGGLTRGADSSRILVKRFENDVDSISTFVCSYRDSTVYNFKLKPDDRIIISYLPDFRVYRNVTIRGEVQYPGSYPIQKDKTKLSELIEMAGGLTKNANLKNSKIYRKTDAILENRQLDRLQKLPADFITPMERNYIYTRLSDVTGLVSLNLENLKNDDSDVKNFVLRDGDEINIVANVLSVKVMGAVVYPGLIEYREGTDNSYYIHNAGGFSSRANKHEIKVLKNGSETWNDFQDIARIEPGDVIWVPQKPYHNGLNITKEILILVGSIASVIISGLTIANSFKSNDGSN